MTKDERIYITWYEGRTFKVKSKVIPRNIYTFGDVDDGEVKVLTPTDDGRHTYVYRYPILEVLKLIATGKWKLID